MLRVLIVEDSEDDATLLLRELRKGGFEVEPLRVETAATMAAALAERTWDIVLADYSLPRFDAKQALAVLQASGHDLPFILVSGTIGEETAVDALKQGAHDFMLKGRLARLLPAVKRELREAAMRRERSDVMAELKDAVRARDEFLSIASHELKTPIMALELQLASTVDLVRSLPGLANEKLEAKLATASRQVARLTVLVNNLLDVTRITSGRHAIARRQVDLVQVVRGVLDRMRETIRRSRSEVVLREQGPTVGWWDPIALEIVVNNLLSNALKFGEGKPITLQVDVAGEVARLRVVDCGIGIRPEAQERIFQRFERAVSMQHYGGFGIGLWVVRQIAEAHGGAVRVTSREGEGSTFTIQLPAGAELAAADGGAS